MDWSEFLSALAVGIEVLARRLTDAQFGSVSSAPRPPVCYAPNRCDTGPDDCLIGVGSAPDSAEDAGRDGAVGIWLNDKVVAPASGNACGVTALALDPPSSLLAEWRRTAGDDRAPERFLGRFELVVEDASPDGCLGLIALLAILNGVPAAGFPRAWRTYVAQWEQGASRTPEPAAAWGPLLAALVHGSWDAEDIRAGGRVADLALSYAWLEGLRLTHALLAVGSAPEPIDAPPACPTLERALALLRYEHQLYRQIMEQSERLQLLLPMSGPARRFRLVDACLLDELTLAGAVKILLRNDREHTWLGDGFGLMALHRPGLAGTGDDMTISVDPAIGVHLRDLWAELERLEDAAWDGRRPCDRPRPIASYPDGRRADGSPSPNQPWWDDRGSHSLLGAPRELAAGQPGTRLSWRDDVLEALWRHGRPDRLLQVVTVHGVQRPLLDRAPELIGDSGKGRLLLRWPRPGIQSADQQMAEPVLLSPTLKRCLAARLEAHWNPAGDCLAALPSEDSFDFHQLPGGYALTHGRGVLVLDDWRSAPLCEAELEREIDHAAARLALLNTGGKEANALIQQLHKDITGGYWRRLSGMRVLDHLAEIRIRLRDGLTRTATSSDDAGIRAFRAALERRWGIAGELERIERSLDETEQTLRSYAELGASRLINFLTVLGLPLAIAAGFFSFLFEDMPRELSKLPVWLAGDLDGSGLNLTALLLFLLLVLAGTVAIYAVWGLARWWARRRGRS